MDPAPRAGARGPYAKSAARRLTILQAARDTFAERGFEESSLREIAQRAGMTHAGLLHHFRTKDDLLLAVLEQRDQTEAQRGHDQGRPGGMSDFMSSLLAEHQQNPELLRLWLEITAAASRDAHPGHAYFVERYHEGRRQFADYFLGQRGHDEQAQVDAALIMAVLDGLQLQWLLTPDLDIDAAFRRFVALITRTPDLQGK